MAVSQRTNVFKKTPIPTDLVKRDIKISDNARTVLEKRYLRRGDNGKPIETEQEMFWRVAYHVALAEKALGGDEKQVEQWARRFFDLLTNLEFFPNSPTFTGAGTPLGQLAACFVLPIDDDMGRTGAGIFETLRNAALIQQTGGGNGFSFSRLRPSGDLVKSSSGKATGPVGFLRVYDQAFGEIAQGGSRRGANMAVLRVDHPNIRDFVKCKSSEGSISNFNISVGITDKFMQAVDEGTGFDLINPHDGSVWETIDARELFNMIVKYAHHNGEPGVLFLDAANRENPVPHLYELESTNPCGEQFLGPFENCCLGSINLAQHVTADDRLDWAQLAESVATSTRFLDDVVTSNAYVPAVPQLREAAERVRRIGLGIMGLADMMYALGIRYGSLEGQEFASQVMEFVRYQAMKTSVELAQERGAFPAIEGSRFDPNDLKWTAPVALVEHKTDWGRPTLEWQALEQGIREHGIRNGAITTIAPTGTISTVSGCEGYGCEPVFALAYMRYVNTNAGNSNERMTLQYTSPLFERALLRAGLSQAEIDHIITEVNKTGSCQNVPEVPDNIRRVFVTAGDISAEEHIWMQAVLQAHTDNAISKTCNFPAGATEEDVAKAYFLGWKLGCKGLTVYVTGSRDVVVLETAETKEKREGKAEPSAAQEVKAEAQPLPLFNEKKKPRPSRLSGRTYRMATPVGATYVTVNENGHGYGQPFELFIHTAKAGSETAAVSEAIGRLMSLILRQTGPVSPRDRIREMVRQLRGIGGARQMGFGPNRVASLPDGIAQVLEEYLADTEEVNDGMAENKANSEASKRQLPLLDAGSPSIPEAKVHAIGDLCPECGDATLIREEGCLHCYTCGYSEC